MPGSLSLLLEALVPPSGDVRVKFISICLTFTSNYYGTQPIIFRLEQKPEYYQVALELSQNQDCIMVSGYESHLLLCFLFTFYNIISQM